MTLPPQPLGVEELAGEKSLHVSDGVPAYNDCTDTMELWCDECGHVYPCPTARLIAQVEALSEEDARLRRLMARAYHAYYKEEWQEGECFDELASDLKWEGEDCYAAQAQRAARKEPR